MSKTREERLEYLRADSARRDKEREEAKRAECAKRAEKRRVANRARYLKEKEKRAAYCHAHLKERAEWLRRRRLLLKQRQSKPESGV